MKKRRNGAFGEFNKLHWFWKFMLISGSFGVIHAVIRRAKGEPGLYDQLTGPPEPDEFGEFDPSRNKAPTFHQRLYAQRPWETAAYDMPPWLRQQMAQRGQAVSLSSAPLNEHGSWQSRWDRFKA